MMTSWGRQFLVKHHPSLTTHRVPCWVPLALPHLVGREALSLIHSPAGGGMGTSWAGLRVQRPLADAPLPGSLPSFAFSFPRPDLTALPTLAALHQEGDLEPTSVWEIHLENRDAGAWPGAGLKDCEQGTVLRSLLAGEKRWVGSSAGRRPGRSGFGGRLLRSALHILARLGQAPCGAASGQVGSGPRAREA